MPSTSPVAPAPSSHDVGGHGQPPAWGLRNHPELPCPSHLSLQAVGHGAKNLSAASLRNAFVARPSKPVGGLCCAEGGIDLPHCPTEGINNVDGSREGAEKAAVLDGEKSSPWGCGIELTLMI